MRHLDSTESTHSMEYTCTHTYRIPPAKIWCILAGITSKNDSTGSMHIHRLKHILKCAVTSARRAFLSSTWVRRYSFSLAEPDPHARHWVESEKPYSCDSLNFLLKFVMYLPYYNTQRENRLTKTSHGIFFFTFSVGTGWFALNSVKSSCRREICSLGVKGGGGGANAISPL